MPATVEEAARGAVRNKTLGFVYQFHHLLPEFTALENICIPAYIAGKGKAEAHQKATELLDYLNLSERMHHKPSALSGGEQQRVAIARTLAPRPKVLFMDEPLSNLDAQLRTQMRMELKKLHLQMKTTTIYVTHDQIEAMTLADRIVVLKDGDIQQVGTPIDVFEKPDNVFVARFIGNPPANILSGVVQRENGQASVAAGGLTLPIPKDVQLETGREVLVGIRPDAIKAGQAVAGLPESWRFQATVVVSETVGAQSLLEFDLKGSPMIAELEGRVLFRPGVDIDLGFDLNRILLFDPQTEQALR